MTGVWVAVLVVGAVSLGFRVLPLITVERIGLGPRAADGLRHAGAGAITALVLLAVAGAPRAGGGLAATLLAVSTGALLARRGRSMAVAVLAGGAVYAATLALWALLP